SSAIAMTRLSTTSLAGPRWSDASISLRSWNRGATLADRKRVGDVERRRGVVSEDVAANSTDGARGQQYSVAIDSRGSSQLDDATLRLQLLGASARSAYG